MTKEEILEKRRHILGNQLMALLSDTILNMMDEWAGAVISNSSSITTTHQIPKRILDEYAASYAKQQTVSFTNWTTSAECDYSCSDEDEWNNIHNPQETITSEQLYDKFIVWQTEQQNKP